MNENENALPGLDPESPESNALSVQKTDNISKENKIKLSDTQEEIQENNEFDESLYESTPSVDKIETGADRTHKDTNDKFDGDPLEFIGRDIRSPMKSNEINKPDSNKDDVDNAKSDSFSDFDHGEGAKESSDKISVQSEDVGSDVGNIHDNLSENVARSEIDQNELDESTNWPSDRDMLSATKSTGESSVKNGDCYDVRPSEKEDFQKEGDEQMDTDALNDSDDGEFNDERMETDEPFSGVMTDEENPLSQARQEEVKSKAVVESIDDLAEESEDMLEEPENSAEAIDDETRESNDKTVNKLEQKNKLDDSEDRLDESEDNLDETEDKLEDTEDKLEESDDKLEECEDKLEETDDKLEECEDKLEETDDKLKDSEEKLEETDNKSEECEDKLGETDNKSEEGDTERPNFESAVDHNIDDSATENQSQNADDSAAETTSQALDPFDELAKAGNVADDSNNQASQETEEAHSNVDNENDASIEGDSVAELDESVTDLLESESGKSGEKNLLPDSEQEPSQDDKLDDKSDKVDDESDKVDDESDKVGDESIKASNEPDKPADVPASDAAPTPRRSKRETPLSVKPSSLLMRNEVSKTVNENDGGGDNSTAGDLNETMDTEESTIGTGGDVEKPVSLFRGPVREVYKGELTPCLECGKKRAVLFTIIEGDTPRPLCSSTCLKEFRKKHKCILKRRKITVEEIDPFSSFCANCRLKKNCTFQEKQGEHFLYFCSEKCVQGVINGDKGRTVTKYKKGEIRDIALREETCKVCQKKKMCRYETTSNGITEYICENECMETLGSPEITKTTRAVRKKKLVDKSPKPKTPSLKLKVLGNATDKYLEKGAKVLVKTAAQAALAREERDRSFRRACAQCHKPVDGNERNLSWETMDFCDEGCLSKYQTLTGSNCANCKVAVNQVSLGKYCVRFGYDVRQFCCSRCLEEFKKGLKICCYCQRDITGDCEGFLAPVGDKGQFKDFCSQPCMEKFDQMSKNPTPPAIWANCSVCSHQKLTHFEVDVENTTQRLCSEPCFAAFKFVNNVFPDQCRWCKKYFERKSGNAFTIYADSSTHCFCSKACFNVYISNSRHIVPCNWCKVKKYNFDMIKKNLNSGQQLTMCSLNCLTLYQVSVNAVSSRRVKCDKCGRVTQAQYHLTMSDATVRNFCTYQCVMSFQGQYSKSLGGDQSQLPAAVPTGAPRRTNQQRVPVPDKAQLQNAVSRATASMPVISNVASLSTKNRTSRHQLQEQSRHQLPPLSPIPTLPQSPAGGHATRAKSKAAATASPAPKAVLAPPPAVVAPPPPPPPPPRAPTPPPPPPKIYSHVLIKPPPPVEVRNMATSASPVQQHRAVSCRPQTLTKDCQTGDELERRVLIPVPVPIYVPVPVAMYSLPFPVPIPIPLPIPTPVFIPTTRNSAEGIMKEIKKIHEKMPTDPFEAELLMMAEMVAGDKKKGESDSDTDEDNDEGFSPTDGGLETTHGHNNNAFGEDMLQMALKMATEYDEPAVDLESAMQANTITPAVSMDEHQHGHHHQQQLLAEQQRAAAAAALAMRGTATPAATRKRGGSPAGGRRSGGKRRRDTPAIAAPPMPEPPPPPQEKPDANMCLKYTFGVNAWKQWVMTKNAEMEKSTIRRKPFKSEILQLTADELNYSLCLFVKEVRKPNGSEYAPDTIYYLVLGIQQYLFENGRIDNIFTDPYYEKFTECLDEVARKFSVLYNDSQYIVTRVEEEHLWESKQLGAHSPHVLLSTLMFFNTKHFNLVTVEEHMQLSFSHIMKHWKRNPNSPGAAKMPGSRNVLLRFYPPQSALEANSRKKKVYEQQENEENPLRCPVKLYEFYLSKCPESVKTRNDVFYLLPERSCVPDSPVWYSTQALAKDALAKMLHRVKMVKEINIALLTS